MMEHPRIDDDKILDLYLAGQLGAEDEELFETHLFECADCLAEVEAGEELRRGLRAVALQDAVRQDTVRQDAPAQDTAPEQMARAAVTLGLLAWLRRRPAVRFGGLAALALILMLPSAMLLRQRAELGRLRAAGAETGLAAPTGDFLVVSLGVARDADRAETEIRLDPEKAIVLLSLELQDVTAPRYRVTLRHEDDEIRWRGDSLEPNLYDTLLIALPTSFLEPGRYRIQIEGVTATDDQPAGEMRLRVLAGNSSAG